MGAKIITELGSVVFINVDKQNYEILKNILTIDRSFKEIVYVKFAEVSNALCDVLPPEIFYKSNRYKKYYLCTEDFCKYCIEQWEKCTYCSSYCEQFKNNYKVEIELAKIEHIII